MFFQFWNRLCNNEWKISGAVLSFSFGVEVVHLDRPCGSNPFRDFLSVALLYLVSYFSVFSSNTYETPSKGVKKKDSPSSDPSNWILWSTVVENHLKSRILQHCERKSKHSIFNRIKNFWRENSTIFKNIIDANTKILIFPFFQLPLLRL